MSPLSNLPSATASVRTLAAAALFGSLGLAGPAAAEDATVITLTQTGCQFLESENGVDHGYSPANADECRTINAETGSERLESANVLKLKPGSYVFRVSNEDVPYPLGFWIRESDYDLGNPIHKLSKTSVSGGGLTTGTTKDYEVELEPGEYVYSCPLNPTPDYRIVVEG